MHAWVMLGVDGISYLSICPSLPSPLQLGHTIWAWSFLAAFARSLTPALRMNPAPSHSGHLHAYGIWN